RALLEACASRARELGLDFDLVCALLDIGILELAERRYAQAVTVFVESLERARGRGLRTHVAMSLRGLAAATAGHGELEAAARLLGSADRLLEETGYAMENHERDVPAQLLALVLDRADDPEIAAALAAGRAMTDSEAAAYALATTKQPATVASGRVT